MKHSSGMDENTRMMIQLASMMMQNEKEIKEAQKELGSDTPGEVTSTDKAAENVDEIQTASADSPSKASATYPTNPFLGMDQKLMTEFAKQIMMNASTASGISGRNPGIFFKKSGTEKPVTIAQLIQSQNALMTNAKQSSEGKIFVYNSHNGSDTTGNGGITIKPEPVATPSVGNGIANGGVTVKQEVLPTPPVGNGSRFSANRSQRRNLSAPFRNRQGRVLRPGIDNFGRFEAVANPGLIMHAMELLRQKDKKKRGPKEKEAFSVFIYCLPDKNSKLPKFSSLDPLERSLVDQQQQEGYGYPSQDYINGIPRKTQLCLTYDEEKFHAFMISIYPRLDGRLYDMYRIDKTRRLIRVDAKSPRQLKDMKYQGSVIVIPYTDSEDRPAPVIHRNFDDCYSNSNNNSNNSSPLLGNPLNLIQNFRIPLPSLPELVAEVTEKAEEQLKKQLPVYSDEPLELTKKPKAAVVNGTSSCEEMEYDSEDSLGRSNGNMSECLFDAVKILKNASVHRNRLKSKKRLHVKPESIFTDMLNAYRTEENLIHHNITFCFQSHTVHNNNDVTHDDDLDSGSVFVMFWEETMRKLFTGNQDMVPIIDPGYPADCFRLLGKILIHGLVLHNYLPLKFSPACMTQTIVGTSSERLLLTSLYRIMSDSEKEVLENAMEEVKMGLESFSPIIENSIKVVLGIYGCRKPPQPSDLDMLMINVAKSCLVHQPFWALEQIRAGIQSCGEHVLSDVNGDDVLLLYQILTPHVPTLLERVIYLYPEDSEANDSSKFVKKQFEEYLYKLPKPSLLKLLYQWCGFDCLCMTELFVKFIGAEEICGTIFFPRQSTLCLPEASVSVDELQGLFETHLPVHWEYTL